jgi:hypothetical protein
MAELLVGVWFNLLFRHPTMMLSDNGKEINSAILWCSKLVLEHMMCLEEISEEYSFGKTEA